MDKSLDELDKGYVMPRGCNEDIVRSAPEGAAFIPCILIKFLCGGITTLLANTCFRLNSCSYNGNGRRIPNG